MLKKYTPYIILFYVCAVAALITASFADLRLDIALNNPANPFSRWFEAFGETPCRLVSVAAGWLIYRISKNTPGRVFGFIVFFGSAIYLGYYFSYYLYVKDEYTALFGSCFGFCIGIVLLYIGKYITIPEEMEKPLLILSYAGLIVWIVQLGCVELIKMLWGRVRFRDLLTMPNYDSFTPWYHPNGFNGNRSFPSGHTGGASMSYLWMLIPFVSEKRDKKRWLCFLVPFVFTSTVAFTRLVMGAHYLSDVTVGGTIGFTAVVIAIAVLDKKYFPKKI